MFIGAISPPRDLTCHDRIQELLIESIWTLRDIAAHLDLTPREVRIILDELIADGKVQQAHSSRFTSATHPYVYRRPAPIRESILDTLTQSRRATEIAEAIGMPIASVTPHLAAMANLNLIVRVRRGVYARPPENGCGQPRLALVGSR